MLYSNADSIIGEGGKHMERKNTYPFCSLEELVSRENEYFTSCKGVQAVGEDGLPIYDRYGNPVMTSPERPVTVTGLALALGFRSREELIRFKGKRAYTDELVRALSRVEEYAEEKLFDKGQSAGAKFFLANNFKGWQDKPDNSDDTVQRLDAVLEAVAEAMKGG